MERKKRAKLQQISELCKYFCNFLRKKVFLLSKPCTYAKFLLILHPNYADEAILVHSECGAGQSVAGRWYAGGCAIEQ